MNGSCQVPKGVNVNFKFSIGIIALYLMIKNQLFMKCKSCPHKTQSGFGQSFNTFMQEYFYFTLTHFTDSSKICRLGK